MSPNDAFINEYSSVFHWWESQTALRPVFPKHVGSRVTLGGILNVCVDFQSVNFKPCLLVSTGKR